MNPIPENELKLNFSRSSGAGGQNVNKVETKVTVRWNFQNSPKFSQDQKNRIAQKLKNRINEAGELAVSSQSERSQSQNRQSAIRKINELAAAALKPQRKRKPTRPTFASREIRLKNKKISARKNQRLTVSHPQSSEKERSPC